MIGLYKGAYIVTARTSIGGSIIYDIGLITSGNGIMSQPWMVKSLISLKKYTVRAMEIISTSYYYNSYLNDAELIYKSLTGIDPKYPVPDVQNM